MEIITLSPSRRDRRHRRSHPKPHLEAAHGVGQTRAAQGGRRRIGQASEC